LDIVIPVYNEDANILRVLDALGCHVRTPFRVLICYDHDDDTTLVALRDYVPSTFTIALIKNQGQGALGAVVSGFAASTAPAVLVFPADDDYNAPQIDAMLSKLGEGCELVAGSRFMPGGSMVGCPLIKAVLCRAVSFVMRHVMRLGVHDATNGFRLFSRRVVQELPIETTAGFAYSLELLVKCHRLGWKVGEVPVQWRERSAGKSRFRVFRWAPHYLQWVAYAAATTFLGRGPESVNKRRVSREPTSWPAPRRAA
jgi:glycosyltransferase involved in cell wall biosynthesis